MNNLLTTQTSDEYAEEMTISFRTYYERCIQHNTEYPDTSIMKPEITNEQYHSLIGVNNMDDLIKIVGKEKATRDFYCRITRKTYPEISTIFIVRGFSDFPIMLCREVVKEWLSGKETIDK